MQTIYLTPHTQYDTARAFTKCEVMRQVNPLEIVTLKTKF